MNLERILLIKMRYIGDVILTTPLLPLLAKRFPSASLSFLVNPGTDEVLQGNPFLDRILVLPRSGWKDQVTFIHSLRKQKYDGVLDLTDGDRSAFISLASGARFRVGFNRDGRWRGKLYTHVLPSDYGSMHMVDYHGQVLKVLGISDAVGRPEMYLRKNEEDEAERIIQKLVPDGRPMVLLYPAARYIFKAWPIERFAALADRLEGQGVGVAVIGHQREEALGRRLLELCRSKPANLMGATNLRLLGALMKFSSLVIGNDGGPLHMAGAVGCPVLGLFGPSDPRVWAPRGSQVSVIYKGLDCRDCFYPGCQRGEESCMKLISVDEVFDHACHLLSIGSGIRLCRPSQ
jgi:predicted lipopolysaccharide heptosyltransferase III